MRIQVEITEQEDARFTLTRAETLVFFDFLVRFDQDGRPDIRDLSEQLLFWHLLSALKRTWPEELTPDYPRKVAAARETVRNSA